MCRVVLCCAVMWCVVLGWVGLCWVGLGCVVLGCVVLCCVGLCCVVLCYAVMWCAVLCCVVLGCVGLCCVVLCCVVLCRDVMCRVVLCCAVMWCDVMCRVGLGCVVLCCVVLCCVVPWCDVMWCDVMCHVGLCRVVSCRVVLRNVTSSHRLPVWPAPTAPPSVPHTSRPSWCPCYGQTVTHGHPEVEHFLFQSSFKQTNKQTIYLLQTVVTHWPYAETEGWDITQLQLTVVIVVYHIYTQRNHLCYMKAVAYMPVCGMIPRCVCDKPSPVACGRGCSSLRQRCLCPPHCTVGGWSLLCSCHSPSHSYNISPTSFTPNSSYIRSLNFTP